MKNHSLVINGRKFYTAQVVDSEKNETYDQTIIFEEIDAESPPKVVDYYYGEPDVETTVQYVKPLVTDEVYEQLLYVKKAFSVINSNKDKPVAEYDLDGVTEAQYLIQDTMEDVIDEVLTIVRRALQIQ